MRAAIDIGSNSIRLLIAEQQNGQLQAIRQELITTRLGRTERGQRLDETAVRATLDALKHFQTLLTAAGNAEPPVVAATSAVREAADGQAFAARIQQELGWQLRILDGAEEALASYTGAASVAAPGAAVLDVGGGSTELIFPAADGLRAKSVPVGAVRLQRDEVKQEELDDILRGLQELRPPHQLSYSAVGGTITSLAAIKQQLTVYERAAINGTVITLEELQTYYAATSQTPADVLRQRYPLLRERADIIADGILIYLRLADLLGFDRLTVSDCGILDGLLLLS